MIQFIISFVCYKGVGKSRFTWYSCEYTKHRVYSCIIIYLTGMEFFPPYEQLKTFFTFSLYKRSGTILALINNLKNCIYKATEIQS